MPVTEYLKHARECAALAERMNPADKKRLLEIADAWLRMAKVEAEKSAAVVAKPFSKHDGDAR
jgi:hypothetical protein